MGSPLDGWWLVRPVVLLLLPHKSRPSGCLAAWLPGWLHTALFESQMRKNFRTWPLHPSNLCLSLHAFPRWNLAHRHHVAVFLKLALAPCATIRCLSHTCKPEQKDPEPTARHSTRHSRAVHSFLLSSHHLGVMCLPALQNGSLGSLCQGRVPRHQDSNPRLDGVLAIAPPGSPRKIWRTRRPLVFVATMHEAA